MSKEQEVVIMTDTEAESKSITVQHIVMQYWDNSSKDTKDYRDAVNSAESVHMPIRAYLIDILHKVERDPHFAGIWRKYIASIRNKKLCYYDKSGKKVDEMEKLTKTNEWRKFIEVIMRSKSHGTTGVEFIPGPQFKFVTIPQKHIEPNKRLLLKSPYDHEGIKIEELWNFFIVGDKDDLGFLAFLAPFILWKTGDYGDWAQFCEIYGMPTELYKYDVNDLKTKKAAADLMKNAGGKRRFLFPNQLAFEVIQNSQNTANGELFEKLKDSINKEISVCVLGATETTVSSSSSGHAQSKEHGEQQDEIMNDDLEFVKNTVNDIQIHNILKSYLYPVSDGGYWGYDSEPNLDMLVKKLSIYKQVSEKVPVAEDDWYNTFHIPKPKDFDVRMKKMEEDKQARNNSFNKPPSGGKPGSDKRRRKNSLHRSPIFSATATKIK